MLSAVVTAVSSATAMVAITAVTPVAVATVAVLGRVVPEVLVLFSDVAEQILTQFLGSLDLVWVWSTAQFVIRWSSWMGKPGNSRYMQEHRIVAFALRAVFDETGATALDLDTAAGLLLDVLHIRTTLTNDLGAQIKPGNRLKIDWDALVRPFAL